MTSLKHLENSSIIRKYPTYRNKFINGCWKWIEGKRKDDNAGELWRVHDGIYDLTDFLDKHPGGRNWLELTKVCIHSIVHVEKNYYL